MLTERLEIGSEAKINTLCFIWLNNNNDDDDSDNKNKPRQRAWKLLNISIMSVKIVTTEKPKMTAVNFVLLERSEMISRAKSMSCDGVFFLFLLLC